MKCPESGEITRFPGEKTRISDLKTSHRLMSWIFASKIGLDQTFLSY